MKLKALLVAVTLAAAAGQAYAVYNLPSAGNGPLIFSAWVPTAAGGAGAGDSVVDGLSISLNSFLPSANHPTFSISLTSLLTDFISGGVLNPGLLWNVTAADSNAPPIGTGYRLAYTSLGGPSPSPSNANIFNATTNANTFVGQQNAAIGGAACVTTSTPTGNAGSCESKSAGDNNNPNNAVASKWGTNFGISGIFNGSAAPGQLMQFFLATAGATSGTLGNSNTQYHQTGGAPSTWALSTAGLLTWSGSAVAAVPEPASVTTLLAGLAFLVGVVRRRLSS